MSKQDMAFNMTRVRIVGIHENCAWTLALRTKPFRLCSERHEMFEGVLLSSQVTSGSVRKTTYWQPGYW